MQSNNIPSPGEESSFPLNDDDSIIANTNDNDNYDSNKPCSSSFIIRHGSSLSLQAQICQFLANPIQDDTFSYVDPTADHYKWARRGLSLYYACVVEVETTANHKSGDNDGTNNIVCALRAVTEHSSNSNHDNNMNGGDHSIFLIDYVYTSPTHRDKGMAGKLISKVLQMAKSWQGVTLGVLSLEQSCVYWLEKHGFLLCTNQALNDRLNVFPDTHLLIHEDCMVDNDAVTKNGDSSSREEKGTQLLAALVPPESFAIALKELLQKLVGTSHSGLSECLQTIAKLIQNAMNDDTDDGKRQSFRMNNPKIHQKVFAVGGESAMNVLQECGFELQR